MVIILGKVSVPAPGTPVQLTATAEYLSAIAAAFGASQVPFVTCQAVLFQAWKGNSDEVYIGKVGMNRTTGAGVAAVLGVPSAGSNPSFGAANQMSPAGIDLSAFYLDADIAAEGALVTLLVT
jgi:hypothetical protein